MHNNIIKKRRRNNFDFEKENNTNIFNEKILDSILEDNEKKFTEIIIQKTVSNSKKNQGFTLTNYKLPNILKGNPSYASLCAFFGAENCFDSLLMLFPDGIKSKEIKQLDDFNRSLLHFACAGGYLSIIRKLEQEDFDINAKDLLYMTPCRYAAMMGHLDVIKYLWTKGADVISLSTDIKALSSFHLSCLYGNLDIAKFIFETILSKNYHLITNSDEKETPLHLACEGGHSDIVQYLITLGEYFKRQVNFYDYQSRTPIIVACQNGSLKCIQILTDTGKVTFDMKKKKHLPLIEASSNGHLDIVKYLLSQNVVSVNEVNSKGITSLQASILNNHPKVAQLLIEYGAVDHCNDSKLCELYMDACRASNLQIMKILDSKCQIPYEKVEKNIKWGDKFMQQACLLENKEMVAFLLSKNCNFDQVDLSANVKNDWSSFMDFLIQNNADLNRRVNNKQPLIVTTIETGNLKRVKKMISMGATLDIEIISDFNCIFVACDKGKLDLFNFLMSYEPIITDYVICIKQCIFKYAENQSKNNQKVMNTFFFMIEKIITSQKVNLNENKSLISNAASLCCLKILELFEKYGTDFANCNLNIAEMQSKSYLPIYHFLDNRGCKFDKGTPILDSLFCNSQFIELDSDVLKFLLNFVSNDEIINFYNYCGNITDVLIRKRMEESLFEIYTKVGKVILPKKIDKVFFYHWIDNCNFPKLKDLVYNPQYRDE